MRESVYYTNTQQKKSLKREKRRNTFPLSLATQGGIIKMNKFSCILTTENLLIGQYFNTITNTVCKNERTKNKWLLPGNLLNNNKKTMIVALHLLRPDRKKNEQYRWVWVENKKCFLLLLIRQFINKTGGFVFVRPPF